MNKKIFLLLIFLISVCVISHVCAEDNSTLLTSDNDGDNLKIDSDSEVLADESKNSQNSTVEKTPAVIKAHQLTVSYDAGTSWKINLIDQNTNKGISNSPLSLKIYTGNKYKQVNVNTDSKGQASFSTKGLDVGTHKVILTSFSEGYDVKEITSYIKVKAKKLKFTVYRKTFKDGSSISIIVKDKSTKKALNGVKLKLYIYKGKKVVKTITLKTKKFGKYNGVTGYATNRLSVGKHKVLIKPLSKNYNGLAKSKMVIKKSAKKYKSWMSYI